MHVRVFRHMRMRQSSAFNAVQWYTLSVSVEFSDTGGKSGLLQIWQCLRQPGCLQKQKMYFFCKKEDIRKVQIVSFPHSQKQQWLKSTDCQAQQQQRQSLCQYLLNSLTHSHSSPTKTAIISDHWSKITTIISDHWSHIMAVLVSHHHNVLISSWISFLFFVFFPVSVCPYETATVSDHNDVYMHRVWRWWHCWRQWY